MKKQEYFSDEELMKFLDDVEMNEMEAPFYLQEEIMKKAFGENEKIVSLKERKRQYYFYQFKVGIAMVAAILLLFLMPAGMSQKLPVTNGKGVQTVVVNMKKTSDKVGNQMSQFSKKLVPNQFQNNNK